MIFLAEVFSISSSKLEDQSFCWNDFIIDIDIRIGKLAAAKMVKNKLIRTHVSLLFRRKATFIVNYLDTIIKEVKTYSMVR